MCYMKVKLEVVSFIFECGFFFLVYFVRATKEKWETACLRDCARFTTDFEEAESHRNTSHAW